jgi:hypothetical protein
VINTLHERSPDTRIVVRSSAPKWLFDLTLLAPVEWLPAECDTGVVQIDSLRVDVPASLQRAREFHENLDVRASTEAGLLRQWDARLVVGDIPPLAFAAAHEAGLPVIALGNFTWDWIYAAYEEVDTLAPSLVSTISRAYARAVLALRLPMHGGFEPFRTVRDVPFIARRSRRDPAEVRRRFGLPPEERLVLASFGGYGLRSLDLDALAELDGYTVVITSDVEASRRGDGVGSHAPGTGGRLPAAVRLVPENALYEAGYRYEDLVSAVDVVVTKPGYGIIAECAANRTAMLYTSRGRFIEYDVLVREMPRYVSCGYMSNEELLQGRWQTPLDRLMGQLVPRQPDVSGADVVAGILADRVGAG